MKRFNLPGPIVSMACAATLVIGWASGVTFGSSAATVFAANVEGQSEADGMLPFHSEIAYQPPEQVPVPEGKCTEPVPEGLAYLWLSRIHGTANSTHLGNGSYYAELCIFGMMTDPAAPPPTNGIPMGWHVMLQVWTAADGDELSATGRMIGFTAPPGTPGFKFIESLSFLDGGTGRFEYAEGTGTGFVDPVAQTAVYDGWLRYGKRDK